MDASVAQTVTTSSLPSVTPMPCCLAFLDFRHSLIAIHHLHKCHTVTPEKKILSKRTHLKVWLNAIGNSKCRGCEKGFTQQQVHSLTLDVLREGQAVAGRSAAPRLRSGFGLSTGHRRRNKADHPSGVIGFPFPTTPSK